MVVDEAVEVVAAASGVAAWAEVVASASEAGGLVAQEAAARAAADSVAKEARRTRMSRWRERAGSRRCRSTALEA